MSRTPAPRSEYRNERRGLPIERDAAALKRARRPTVARASGAVARPTRRTQAERRATTRGLLIDATIDVIYESGFAAATVTAIAQRAGVTSGALQHHFAARSDLLVAVILAVRDRVESEMKTLSLRGTSVRERIEAICALYWKIFSGRHYLAAVQIELGTMNSPDLFALISDAVQKTEKDLDRGWTDAFADVSLPEDRLKAVRHITLAAIRGMAIRQTHRLKKSRLERERAVLVEMVADVFDARR